MIATTRRRVDPRIARAREILGRYWGLGRMLSPIELARALRLTGDNAPQTVLKWESGEKETSGPVSLCLDLMAPPGEEETETIARWLGEIQLEPAEDPDAPGEGLTLFGLLHANGYDPEGVLRRCVREAAEALKEPPDLDDALAQPVSQKAADRVGVYRTVKRTLRREARIAGRRGAARKKIA